MTFSSKNTKLNNYLLFSKPSEHSCDNFDPSSIAESSYNPESLQSLCLIYLGSKFKSVYDVEQLNYVDNPDVPPHLKDLIKMYIF